MKPVQELKILELGSILAVPSVGMFFAELGARVIKIENPAQGGDPTRRWRTAEERSEGVSAYYASVNWGKEVLMLDLNFPEDRARVHDLVRDCDLVLANYKPSSAAKLQMDYDSLRLLNPRLIYANLTGFGEDNPRAAFDVVLQAEAGFMFMNGQADSPPTKMPVALIDVLAAHHLKEGILLALWERERSGKGAYLSVSLFDAAVSSLVNQGSNWLMSGHLPRRSGSLHPNIAPYGELFRSADGQDLVLAIGTDAQFVKLCHLLGCPELAQMPQYAANAERVKHRQALAAELEPLFARQPAEPLLEQCHQASVPIGLVRNLEQVFRLPQAQALFLDETTPQGQHTRRLRSWICKTDWQTEERCS